ncbi:MAG: phosphatase domain-containing protein [Akkermansiaceae bacterium]
MELFFRSIRRLLLMIEWILGIIWGTLSKLLPFWKIKPVVEIFNAVKFPHNGKCGTWIYGRVLSERKLIPPTPEDSSWINFRRMISQWFTREVPKTGVTVTIGNQQHQVRSDADGYFELLAYNVSGAYQVSLDSYDYKAEFESTGSPEIPEYVIITDVDDTLLETGAISLGKMIKTTLLGNSLTRDLVPGISELINELHHNAKHPVFYVTSSPWNLHGFLGRVFSRAMLPKGGIFMTDWGLTPKQWLTPSHDAHKGDAIHRISEWYQNSQFLLFGDDSQKDHTIYADFIRKNPDKIKAAFIRTVAGEEKMELVQQMMDALNQEIGREVMFVIHTAEEIKEKLTTLP